MPAILYSSPKGGVGKTTIAARTAALLAKRGHPVVALDLDPQNALRLHFGLPLSNDAGFMSQLGPDTDWRTALAETAYGVDLLSYGSSDPFNVLRLNAALMQHPALLADPVRDILRDPETVLVIDSPPGPSPAVAAVASSATLVAVVLLADAASACLMPQLISGRAFGSGTVGSRMSRRAGVVVNQVDLDRELDGAVLDSATRLLGPKLLGAVCWDDAIADDLAHARLDTTERSRSANDLGHLVDEIERRVRPHQPRSVSSAFPALAEWGLA